MANRYWVGGNATWDATAGTKWSATSGGAGGASVPTAADIALFDAASGASTVTIGSGTAICLQLNMTGFTGTLAFGSNSIELPGSGVAIYVGATTFSVTGTPVINCTYAGSTGTRTIACAAVTEANTISFNITAGTDTVNIQNNCKNLNFTGFSGTLSNANTRTIFGNLTISTGMSLAAGAVSMVFGATSGTQQVTSNGKTFDFPLNQNGAGGTVQLQDNLTVGSTRTYTLTTGTLDLNVNKVLSTGIFISSNSNARTIAFGSSGNITVTGNNATVWTTNTSTNLTISGTPAIYANYSGSTGTRTINNTNTLLNLFISAGSDTVTLSSNFSMNNISFSGFSGTLSNTNQFYYGDVIYSATMTLTAGTLFTAFNKQSGTQKITCAGLTLPCDVYFDSAQTSSGTTYELQDNFTQGAKTTYLYKGTLNLNNKTYTTAGIFSTANSNTRSIAFGSTGSIVLSGAGLAFDASTPTNLTTSGTGTINLTSASSKTFNGGGVTYPTINQGGTGVLNIVGNNTFSNITNSVVNTTVLFTAGATNTFSSFSLSGTSLGGITIGSITAGSSTNLRDTSGLISVSYCTIKDTNAIGGAIWTAYYDFGNIDAGNNTGWDFGGSPSYDTEYGYKLRSFTEHGRF